MKIDKNELPKRGLRLHYTIPDTPANREGMEREFASRRAMCAVGEDPRKTELGHQNVLTANAERRGHDREGNPIMPDRWQEARLLVRIHRPKLRPDSAAFNAEVARIVAGWAE